MSASAVLAHELGKRFRIGVSRARYQTLRESLMGVLNAPVRAVRKIADRSSPKDAFFWALRNVSFEVRPGEVVGIIGRNGAGKSTLLKILSRITQPTEGYAEIRGRVSSLLEVGTGFHNELTGRENVYLNSAILGLKRGETQRKFDEIVAFAEVEKFIDTPVKHYSSGMYLRLAFAVAAHLEPDILIVDEVLAVGDARFQNKCMNKMKNFEQQGRTILFVSHNMPAITRLCERVVLLDGGVLSRVGPAPDVVREYLRAGLGTTAAREWPEVPGGEVAGLFAVRVRTEDGRITDTLDIRRPVRIEMEYDVWKPGHKLMPYFRFTNEEGVVAFTSNDVDPEWRGRPRPAGRYASTVWLPGNYLAEGTMFVTVGLTTINPDRTQFQERDAVAFQIIDSLEGDSARGDFGKQMPGVVRPLLKWTTELHADSKAATPGG